MSFKCVLLPETERVIERSLETYKKANPYRYKEPDKYVALLNEFYAEEGRRRMVFASKIKERIRQKDNSDVEKYHSLHVHRERIVDFSVNWCWTFNPKNPPRGLPALIPFVPWYDQIETIEWFYDHYLNGRGGAIAKSREQGLTWLFVLIYGREWRYTKDFSGGIGSNKLENVDERDNPDCIFEKLRILIRNWPGWMMPEGFDWRKHDKIGNLVNPENRANIVGQGGDQIGRGGRRGVYLVDEKAFLESPEKADAALSRNTDCQMDLSTYNGPNSFYEKCESGRVDVRYISWKNNPMLNEEWYENEVKRLDPTIVAQEIDMNPLASVEGIFIRPEWVEAAVDFPLEKKGIKQAGLDIEGGGKDLNALAKRIGPVLYSIRDWHDPNGIDVANTAIDECNEDEVEVLHYDRLSVGHAVHSALHRTERQVKFQIFGVGGGDAKSDLFYPEFDRYAKDIFADAVTEWYYMLRCRFKKTWEQKKGMAKYLDEELISIPNHGKLKRELSSRLRVYTNTGKMKVESKKDMKSRGILSPNLADATAMAFIPKDAGHKHIVDDFPVSDFNVFFDNERPNCLQYAVVCQNEDLSIDIICCAWHEHLGHLFVHNEIHTEMMSSEELADAMINKMQLRKYEIKKILGNKQMFAKDRKSVARSINKVLRKKMQDFQIVKIKEPMRYDPKGSMLMANNLIRKKKLTVNTKCKEVVRQLSNWRLDRGKAKEDGMREGLLIVLSELVRIVSFKEVMKNIEYHGKLTEKQEKVYIRESL